MGLETEIIESNKEVHFYSSGQYRSTVICRSMEKPGSIVGFKIGKALIDELDVLPMLKAEHAWRKIIARLRHQAEGLQNGVSVTTTPEASSSPISSSRRSRASKLHCATSTASSRPARTTTRRTCRRITSRHCGELSAAAHRSVHPRPVHELAVGSVYPTSTAS